MRANNEQLEYVRSTVARGEYRVDPERVAVAMLERIGVRAVSPGEGGRVLLRALTDLRAG